MTTIKAQSRNDVTAIRRNLHRNTDLAVLGQTSDANSPVFVNDRPGYWWVRFIQAGGTYGPAVQVRGCLIAMVTNPGVPVKMGVVEGEKAVIGPDFVGLLSQGVNPTQSAVVDPNANNPGFVNQAYITTAYANIIEGTLTVGLRRWLPQQNDTIYNVGGTADWIADFTGNVPSAGEHCIAVIAVLPDFSALEVTYSTAKPDGITLDLGDVQEAISAGTSGATRLWAFSLADGQTELTEVNRFMDLRTAISPESSGGGTGDVVGPASATNNDLAAFDGTTGKLIKDSGVAPSTDGTFAANSDALLPTQKATKTYTDNAITQAVNGLNPKPEMYVWTNAALPTNTYSNGVSGVGATLTAVATGVLTIDGVTIPAGAYIGVKDEVAQANNGFYFVTTAGAIGVAYVLTRATFADTSAELIGAYAFTTQGTANKDKGFICSNVTAITIGTTAITFELFAAAGINQLTGDVTAGPGTGSQAATLATVNSDVGTFSRVKSVTANAKGLITAITQGLVDLATEVTGVLPAANVAVLPISNLADAYKLAVSAVAGSNINIANPGTSTFDGVGLGAGDRLLLISQSTDSQNGIWTFNTSSTALTRPTDFAHGSSLFAFSGLMVHVIQGGTTYGGAFMRLVGTGTIIIDTTTQQWVQTRLNLTVVSGVIPDINIPTVMSGKTFITPTIADLTNAQHGHTNAAGGGQLNAGSVFSAGQVPLARGGTGVDLSASGSATAFLAQDASHAVSARSILATDLPLYLMQSALINGSFALWSRQAITPTTLTAYSDDTYSGADLWYVLTQTASVQNARVAGDTNSDFAARLKQNQASAQRMGYTQILEGIVTKTYRSKSVRFQARVNISNSQAVRVAIVEWTGTEDAPISDIVNDWTSGTYTTGNFFISTTTTVTAVAAVTPGAATWTDISVTGTVSSSANNIIVFIWTEGTAAQNVTLDIAEVGFYEGGNAVPWQPPDPSVESLRAQRFLKVFNSPSGGATVVLNGYSIANTTGRHPYIPPVPFITTPALTATAGDWDSSVNGAVTAVTAISILAGSTATSVTLLVTAGAGGTSVSKTLQGDTSADRYLILSAEL